MKPKVLICVLTGTERTSWISPELSGMLVQMSHDSRFDVAVMNIKDAQPYEHARNITIAKARDFGFAWMVSCDNDMAPKVSPLDIIASAGPDKDVIGAVYGIRPSPDGACLYPGNPAANCGLFQEQEYVGGGILCVRSTIWRAIPKGPWFRMLAGNNELLSPEAADGCSEDVFFCRAVRSRGFRVFSHSQLAGHYKTMNATSIACAMAKLTEQAKGATPCRP